MATFRETDYIRVIDDAVKDAESLERFVNGEDDQTVITRLSKEYPTLQRALKELFENGGLPAIPFKTKAELLSSSVESGLAVVTNDDDLDKNGIYQKKGDAWEYLNYNFPRNKLNVEKYDAAADEWALAAKGKNQIIPWGIRPDGTVEQPVIKTDKINTTSIKDIDHPFEDIVYAVGGSNNVLPFAINKDGEVIIDKLKVNSIDLPEQDESDAVSIINDDAVINKAIQEWWIYPIHTQLTEPYERIVSSGYSEDGEILAYETIPSLGVVNKVVVDKSLNNIIDDHETPALFAENGRRFVLVWGRSHTHDGVRIYVTDQSGDLNTFADNGMTKVTTGKPNEDLGSTSYNQLIKLPKSTDDIDYFWLFGRNHNVGWGFVEISVNQNTGAVNSTKWTQLFDSLTYMSTADSRDNTNMMRLTTVAHPDLSPNSLHYFDVNKETGDITIPTLPSFTANMDGTGLPITLSAETAAIPDNFDTGQRRRLFYTRSGPINPAILFAEWSNADMQPTYKSAALLNNEWIIREHGEVGGNFGQKTYFSGGCYPDPCTSDMMYLARYDADTQTASLDEVRFRDGRNVIKTLQTSKTSHFIRPISPVNGSSKITFADVTWYSSNNWHFNASVKLINKYGV